MNSIIDSIDWEPSPVDDEIALAARSVVDNITDPTQRASDWGGYTMREGCVRGNCGNTLDLEYGWFCRACRLYMTEIDDIDPLAALADGWMGNAVWVPHEGEMQSVVWPEDAAVGVFDLAMARVAELFAEGLDEAFEAFAEAGQAAANSMLSYTADAEELCSDCGAGVAWVDEGGWHHVDPDAAPCFLHTSRPMISPPSTAFYGVVLDTGPQGEAIPCERCPLPAIEPRNRDERRHPRCVEHPLNNPDPRSQQ